MSVKIAHESPLSIVDKVDELTDYSYFLVHLLEENHDYLDWAEKVTTSGRETILDNSIFELEEAFDASKFRWWVRKIQPTWHIIPDVLEDAAGTMNNMAEWHSKGLVKGSQTIGVVQGKTYEEIVTCYKYMATHVDMIAISFDYSLYREWYPNAENKYYAYMYGRQKLLSDMLNDGIIDVTIPHHLLGNALPQEGKAYKNYDWIYSVDTSNPVVHGIRDVWYSADGLQNKESQKLHTMINHKVSWEEMSVIDYNIKTYRTFWK